MEKLTIYYSVSNGGDGSAYPQWMESLELAEWDQEHMYEGWGEPCTGSIEIEGENLKCLNQIHTKEEFLVDILLDERDDLEEFKKQFFPDGIPEFTVNIIDKKYYGIYLGDKLIDKKYSYPGDTTEEVAQMFKEKLK